MPVILDLARRAAADLGRCTSAGLDLFATATGTRDAKASPATLRALTLRVEAQEERIARLEEALTAQAAGITAARSHSPAHR
jgi:hypothetical protein